MGKTEAECRAVTSQDFHPTVGLWKIGAQQWACAEAEQKSRRVREGGALSSDVGPLGRVGEDLAEVREAARLLAALRSRREASPRGFQSFGAMGALSDPFSVLF